MKIEVEKAKIRLSSQDEYTIVVEDLIPSGFRLTRPRFNELTRPLVERAGSAIQRVFSDMRMSSGDVDALLLVGGTSNVPSVRQFVSELVGREPATGVDPLTAVAEGAAVAAAILTGEESDSDFVVSTEHALGTIALDAQAAELKFSPIIRRNQKLPARQTETFYPVFDNQDSVRVSVIEGDDSEPLNHPDNVILTEFEVPIDPPRLVSEAGFELTYSYDTDGLLHVDVVDAMTAAPLTDRVTVAFKGARDPRELVGMAGRVRSAVESGDPVESAAKSPSQDPRTAELVTRARSKVIPFVDDAEATVIENLVQSLLDSDEEGRTLAQEELEVELRKYTYLW